jgi:two-component system chemotaxis response regulator CheB
MAQPEILKHGQLSRFACPDCHGVMARVDHGAVTTYRCHTGHTFSASCLLAGLEESVETSLWITLRALQEMEMLLDQLMQGAEESHLIQLRKKMEGARRRAQVIEDLLQAD